jgi:hypothetical protein
MKLWQISLRDGGQRTRMYDPRSVTPTPSYARRVVHVAVLREKVMGQEGVRHTLLAAVGWCFGWMFLYSTRRFCKWEAVGVWRVEAEGGI